MRKFYYFPALLLIIIFISLTTQAASVHRVSPGENLYDISLKYGVTVKEIINKNNLNYPDNIFSEQILIIPEAENSWSYRVKKGDTLYLIAKKLGISTERLAEFNGILKTDDIFVRQVLYIPPRPRTYKVKSGDSIYKIAKKFGINVEQILQANESIETNNLHIGQILEIPYPENNSVYSGPNYKKLYPDMFFLSGSVEGNKIALTFDDGPDNNFTPQILDILEKYNVPATFFLIGNRVKKHPDIVNRMVEEGHTIGNHTWSHVNLTKVNDDVFFQEINNTNNIIAETTGLNPSLLRPPYGAISIEIMNKLKDINFKVIHWSVDSRDWIAMDFDKILINTLPAVKRNSILLFHSAGGENHDLSATVEVLPDIIKTLRMNGYTFIKLEELLGIMS